MLNNDPSGCAFCVLLIALYSSQSTSLALVLRGNIPSDNKNRLLAPFRVAVNTQTAGLTAQSCITVGTK